MLTKETILSFPRHRLIFVEHKNAGLGFNKQAWFKICQCCCWGWELDNFVLCMINILSLMKWTKKMRKMLVLVMFTKFDLHISPVYILPFEIREDSAIFRRNETTPQSERFGSWIHFQRCEILQFMLFTRKIMCGKKVPQHVQNLRPLLSGKHHCVDNQNGALVWGKQQ